MKKILQEIIRKLSIINKKAEENLYNSEIKASEKLIEASLANKETLMKLYNSSIKGLSVEEAEKRLEEYGENQIAEEKKKIWIVELFKSFLNPFNGVLFALAMVSIITDVIMAAPEDRSFKTVIVIITMVIISGVLQFVQEYKSNTAAESLKALITNTASVLREGEYKEISMNNLVPGDIVKLSAGDMIPADLRVLASKDLFVGQSSLTGESEPVEKLQFDKKLEEDELEEELNVLELDNICFMGTNVISGTAEAMVITTGGETYFGKMAKALVGERSETSFDKGVNKVSMLLIRFMLVMVPFVFLVNGITKGDWMGALLFSISIAVGLTPEMLPMIVTSNLAKGAVAMAKHKTVVKKISAIQNFGAMDILCTDKTGTLTEDKVVLERHLDIHGNEDIEVLKYAYLNSFHQTGLKNLMDIAVLEHGVKNKLEYLDNKYKKIDEIPFDFVRRRMSVVLENGDMKHHLITKGAVEEMLSVCSYVEYKGEIQPITSEIKEEIKAIVYSLNSEGMRVLAVARKEFSKDYFGFELSDEGDMILVGYIGFLDPPKPSTALAIKALQASGISVKILTGDNDVVTLNICKQVGLEVKQVLLGPEIEKMGDEELAKLVKNTTVFAKLAPLQKSKIIKALQAKGHTVGFLGDGINDAAALKESDVGISVDTAVDIAKESADIILLEKSLMVLEEGVIEGRKTFGNIMKYIKMTASSNFGNMFSVLSASAFLPFLPMLPIQLLIQNLLYDISQTAIPWDVVDEEYLRKPRKWDSKDISRFMVFVGPISSLFDIATFVLMWMVFKANAPKMQSLFQTAWFVEGLLSQTLIVHMIRTRKIPFVQSRAAKPVLLLTAAIMLLGITIPFTAFGASIGFVKLPLSYFPWLILILLSYCTLTQLIKNMYIKKFDHWL